MSEIKDIRVDPWPDENDRVIFYWEGLWVSGWPLTGVLDGTDDDGLPLWEANSSIGIAGLFHGVRFWMIAPDPQPNSEAEKEEDSHE